MTRDAFIAQIAKNGGISAADAACVFALYKKMRLVKETAHDGTSIKHGAFLDRAVIRRAVKKCAQIDKAKAKPSKRDDYKVTKKERVPEYWRKAVTGAGDLWLVERNDEYGAYKYVRASNEDAAVEEATKSRKGWT
jgi:hypothetical protein